MKRYLDIGLSIVIVVLVVAALLGSVYMLTNTLLDKHPVVGQYTLRGEVYECTHYHNGDMECWLRDDPEVGFGRMQE